MKKIAFVIPWYGLDISGGAEAACRNIAERMKRQGKEVEILSTCVKQFNSDWNHNFHKPGEEVLNGVVVRRFKVRKRNTNMFDEINNKLMNKILITYEEEQIFLREMINSPMLEKYIELNKDQYSAFIFIPYMFGTTYYGIQNAMEKAILLPAFHDESYAYFESFQLLYSKVKGMIFLSKAEQEWTMKHYNLDKVSHNVLGLGIEHFTSNPDRFKQKYNISSPFILYAGRKDHGKNVHKLLEYFSRFHELNQSDLRLVLIGGGEIDIPSNVRDKVYDLGYVSEQDKYDSYGAATFFCNPSANESFSIVIMESWYSGTPVLVNEECDVTKEFCLESNGGLYYSNYYEFEACLNLFLNNRLLARRLGSNGRQFVEEHFNWDIVINNYIDFISKCTGVRINDQSIIANN